MSKVFIQKLDETYIQAWSDDSGVEREIHENFTFEVTGYQHMPAYKKGTWDGKIRLYNIMTKRIYVGLTEELSSFVRRLGYEIEFLENEEDSFYQIDPEHVKSYLSQISLSTSDGEPMDLRGYQIDAVVHALTSKRTILLSATACHAAGDKIIMADGSIKAIEEIAVGEFVVGADGNPKEVLALHSGEDELFEVSPRNNRKSITVTGEHLLCLQFTNEQSGKPRKRYGTTEYVSVYDYLNKGTTYKHISKLFYNNRAIAFAPKQHDCRISPYFLGLYLGDGHCGACAITTMDQECADAVFEEASKFGCSVRVKDKKNCRAKTYHIVGSVGSLDEEWQGSAGYIRNKIFNELDKLGLHFGRNQQEGESSYVACNSKYIPEVLFVESESYRLELLAGLIDSDGALNQLNTYFDFTVKSAELAQGVYRLATGLGFVCSDSIRRVAGTNYYRVIIMGDISRIPTRIPRKIVENHAMNRTPYRSGFTVTPVGIGKYYGLTVEDSLYLHESGMVTHNSGKSLQIYCIIRYLTEFFSDFNVMLIVPSKGLVEQMYSDFAQYSMRDTWQVSDHVQKVSGDYDKKLVKPIVITTWQSQQKESAAHFNKFRAIIVDEAHEAAATSLTRIMELANQVVFKIGATGTLRDCKMNLLALTGLFGVPYTVVTTRDMIDMGAASELKIKCLVLDHPEEVKKTFKKMRAAKTFDYQTEIDYIITNDTRNNFIANLAADLKGNTLILFNLVEKQGKTIKSILESKTEKNIYYIDGNVSAAKREEYRQQIVSSETDCILLASYGTTSRGYSVSNIDNIIFASPTKSKVRNLQSIGRGLRLSEGKSFCTLYDIADDFTIKSAKTGKTSKINFTLKHFLDRLTLYTQEQFNYKTIRIPMK